ncbi:hypothetical protein [Cupriavidus basilensis]|uniref:Uncharacterized protein n=1 Tax=Cupriavidus basilensis TaxID=68895 RepID=A0A643FYR6_9BURK|nr:hypothetical protein [Cupriavidus basilensis]QOT82142.1 hypothetical protein F7R26_038370 [Cupriavidus basilensis]
MALSDSHLAALQSRLNYIAEIVDMIAEWSDARDRSILSLLDDIENDVLVIIGSESKPDEEDSTYIMHCSWTSDASKAGMYESLPKKVAAIMTLGIGKILLPAADVEKWVLNWRAAMQELLAAFTRSANLDQAMGRLMGLDIMLTNLLSFIAAMRLNPMIER